MSTLAASLATLGVAGFMLAKSGFGARAPAGNVLASIPIDHSPGLEQIGGYVLVKKTRVGDLLVTHSAESEYTAMSVVCPHLGCDVKVKSPSMIQCPCHQSAYKIDGTYISGPARTSLRRFHVAVESGVISVLEAEDKHSPAHELP